MIPIIRTLPAAGPPPRALEQEEGHEAHQVAGLDSALLEVALCVMSYMIVLWIELSPAFLEKWQDSGNAGLAGSHDGAAYII